MKKRLLSILALFLAGALTACGGQPPAASTQTPDPTPTPAVQSDTPAPSPSPEGGTGSGVLIAYFTRLDNTDADLDAIVQGGGPYGDVGDSFADADLDAITSASITVLEGTAYGNTEAVARMLQGETGGDLFSIQTEEPYPVDYDALIDQGGEEKNAAARPALTGEVAGWEDYDVVFLGFPNWWYDMPMAVYQFVESHDFTGKRVIPFATSAGSGFSATVSTLRDLLPTAAVEESGLHIPMREVADAQPAVAAWVAGLGLETAQEPEPQEEPEMQMTVTYNDHTIVFTLNDSQAARDLYDQLPLTVEMENFSSNEKIFYPPEDLDTTGAPMAAGGAGTLAYYAPWGDVVLFYGPFGGNASLFGLGTAEAGAEWISQLSGTVTFEKGAGA